MSSWPARQPDKGAASAAADFPGAGCRSLRARPSGFKAACGIATHATRRPCGPALTPETTAAPDGSTNGQAAACPGRHAAPGAKPLTMYGWRGKGHLPALLRRSLEPPQYTSAAYAALAEECEITLSVGRTGQCWDNALAESFFSSLKGELIDTRAWPARAGARRAVVEYIAWYNGTRLHSSLGYRSPADYESQQYEKIRRVA